MQYIVSCLVCETWKFACLLASTLKLLQDTTTTYDFLLFGGLLHGLFTLTPRADVPAGLLHCVYGAPYHRYEGCANDGDGGRASHPYGGMPACVRLEPYSQLLVRHGASLDPQAQTTPVSAWLLAVSLFVCSRIFNLFMRHVSMIG